jgi:hypothetical protein
MRTSGPESCDSPDMAVMAARIGWPIETNQKCTLGFFTGRALSGMFFLLIAKKGHFVLWLQLNVANSQSPSQSFV